MKGKTLRKNIKKSVQKTLSFFFKHEKFFKIIGYISSQNVSYCKLKLNTFGLLLRFLWNSACFSMEKAKSAIKLKLLNWPPWVTASAKNKILPGHIDHQWIIICLHTQCLSKSIKTSHYRLCWFIVLITLRKFCLNLLLSVRNYLRKSPICEQNLHLQILKIIILRNQWMTQCWLSFPLAGLLKRLEKQYDFFQNQLNFTCCLWLVMQYFPSLIYCTTSQIVSSFDWPILIDIFAKRKSQCS